jgi:hypothetical protein
MTETNNTQRAALRPVPGGPPIPLVSPDEQEAAEQQTYLRDELDEARDQYRYYRIRAREALKALHRPRRSPTSGDRP